MLFDNEVMENSVYCYVQFTLDDTPSVDTPIFSLSRLLAVSKDTEEIELYTGIYLPETDRIVTYDSDEHKISVLDASTKATIISGYYCNLLPIKERYNISLLLADTFMLNLVNGEIYQDIPDYGVLYQFSLVCDIVKIVSKAGKEYYTTCYPNKVGINSIKDLYTKINHIKAGINIAQFGLLYMLVDSNGIPYFDTATFTYADALSLCKNHNTSSLQSARQTPLTIRHFR